MKQQSYHPADVFELVAFGCIALVSASFLIHEAIDRIGLLALAVATASFGFRIGRMTK